MVSNKQTRRDMKMIISLLGVAVIGFAAIIIYDMTRPRHVDSDDTVQTVDSSDDAARR